MCYASSRHLSERELLLIILNSPALSWPFLEVAWCCFRRRGVKGCPTSNLRRQQRLLSNPRSLSSPGRLPRGPIPSRIRRTTVGVSRHGCIPQLLASSPLCLYLHLPDFPFYPFHDVVESRKVEVGGVESPRSSYLFPGVSYCDPDERPKSPAEAWEEDEGQDANGCCD